MLSAPVWRSAWSFSTFQLVRVFSLDLRERADSWSRGVVLVQQSLGCVCVWAGWFADDIFFLSERASCDSVVRVCTAHWAVRGVCGAADWSELDVEWLSTSREAAPLSVSLLVAAFDGAEARLRWHQRRWQPRVLAKRWWSTVQRSSVAQREGGSIDQVKGRRLRSMLCPGWERSFCVVC